MKKLIIALGFLLVLSAAKAQEKIPYYYEVIQSSDKKAVNFTFGFYPSTYSFTESGTGSYSTVKCAIINEKQANSLEWIDDKICILLKSGKLIRNYTTKAADGDFACKYTVAPGETHYQNYCFTTKFSAGEIDKIWLVMGDNEIFPLQYSGTTK